MTDASQSSNDPGTSPNRGSVAHAASGGKEAQERKPFLVRVYKPSRLPVPQWEDPVVFVEAVDLNRLTGIPVTKEFKKPFDRESSKASLKIYFSVDGEFYLYEAREPGPDVCWTIPRDEAIVWLFDAGYPVDEIPLPASSSLDKREGPQHGQRPELTSSSVAERAYPMHVPPPHLQEKAAQQHLMVLEKEIDRFMYFYVSRVRGVEEIPNRITFPMSAAEIRAFVAENYQALWVKVPRALREEYKLTYDSLHLPLEDDALKQSPEDRAIASPIQLAKQFHQAVLLVLKAMVDLSKSGPVAPSEPVDERFKDLDSALAAVPEIAGPFAGERVELPGVSANSFHEAVLIKAKDWASRGRASLLDSKKANQAGKPPGLGVDADKLQAELKAEWIRHANKERRHESEAPCKEGANLTTQPSESSSENAGAELSKRPAQKLKEPQEHEIWLYNYRFTTGKKQSELAKDPRVMAVLETAPHQGSISRMLRRVRDWVEAGNILPGVSEAPSPSAKAMDPKILDLGRRQDGRVERQRKKRSDDD